MVGAGIVSEDQDQVRSSMSSRVAVPLPTPSASTMATPRRLVAHVGAIRKVVRPELRERITAEEAGSLVVLPEV